MAQNDNGTTGIGDDDLDENGQAEGDGAPATGTAPARPAHPPVESGALGSGDTRARQAGVHPTGLGSAETGANETPDDMGPGS
jgi:hypothetical protein